MSKVFNFEGPLFTSLSRLADLFWLNLLFILCCVPIVTAGAAATALYYVTLKMAKDEEGYITKSYFKSFKENFVQATVIWILLVAVMAIMYIDLVVAGGGSFTEAINSAAISNVVMVAAGVMTIVLVMTGTYVFPLLAQFDNTVINTIKNAFLISVRHLPYTILLIAITVAPVLLVWYFPPLLIIVVIMFAAVAYINSKIFNRIFILYMPKEAADEGPDALSEGIDGENGEE